MKHVITAFAILVGAVPTLADAPGNAAKGDDVYGKCRACHRVEAPDGTMIRKGGITGPNLYGVVGRKIASEPGYRYGEGIRKLAESYPNAVWDVHSLAAYVTDPTGYLDQYSGDPKARSKMTYKLSKGQADLAAYLLEHSPDAPKQAGQGDGAPRP